MLMPNLQFSFSQNVTPDIVLTNFWPPEDGFVWSTKSWCQLAFDVPAGTDPADGAAELLFDLDVFRAAPDLEGQDIHIYVNGLRLATRYVAARATIVIELAPGQLRRHGNVITIDTPDAARPGDFGEADNRRLGVKLFTVQVRGF
jgi:hypothetical protein